MIPAQSYESERRQCRQNGQESRSFALCSRWRFLSPALPGGRSGIIGGSGNSGESWCVCKIDRRSESSWRRNGDAHFCGQPDRHQFGFQADALLQRVSPCARNSRRRTRRIRLRHPCLPTLQTYVGDRPYQSVMHNWTLTADLHQLHLKNAELYICGGWFWVSWNPAGPKAFQMHTLYLYKAFAERRVEIKAGYIGNNMELIGLSIGGSLATSAQGVYAVLPYEVGVRTSRSRRRRSICGSRGRSLPI